MIWLLALLLQSGAVAETASEESTRVRGRIGGSDSVEQTRTTFGGDGGFFDVEAQLDWTGPYFDLKRRLRDDHGLSFSLSSHLLFQEASETLSGRTSGAGAILRFQGSWKAFARDTGHEGWLDWRIEDRSALGGSRAPFDLGSDTGATALNPANGYSDSFDAGFSTLSWTQLLFDHRAAIVVGRLAYDVYQDALFVQGFSRGFLNRGIFLNPTIGTTGVGALGAVGAVALTENLWVDAMAFDANAVSADFDFDTIQEGEFLKSAAIGWTGPLENFKRDRIHLTYWEKDARQEAGTTRGYGWTLSASWEVADGVLPFLRFGHSNGGAGVAAETSAAAGFEAELWPDRILSVGAMWAEPSSETFGPDPRDEYAIETSFQFILSPNVSLMPDVQLLIDPANAPEEDRVWVFGLRAILSL
ncbi:MAG: carbohydrate porin [Planctomycetota bacterium]